MHTCSSRSVCFRPYVFTLSLDTVVRAPLIGNVQYVRCHSEDAEDEEVLDPGFPELGSIDCDLPTVGKDRSEYKTEHHTQPDQLNEYDKHGKALERHFEAY